MTAEPQKCEASRDPYRYDAYISYAESDRRWVEECLALRLEAAGRRICLEQDLPLGGFEVEERAQAVAASRRTLAVVSGGYLDAGWGVLEQVVTAELDPAGQKRRLIPVLRGNGALPLRIRPLVAVDLRQDGNQRQWQRLLDALDPARQEPPLGLPQRLSLRLAEATEEAGDSHWHAMGLIWLIAIYLAVIAALVLVYFLLRDAPALRDPLVLAANLMGHLAAAAVWREDRDVLRRLSHLLARSPSGRAAALLLITAAAGAWTIIGVPQVKTYLCGPLGCKGPDEIFLIIDSFGVDGAEQELLDDLRQSLARKLTQTSQVKIINNRPPQMNPNSPLLKIDFVVSGRLSGREVILTLWDHYQQLVPPAITARRRLGEEISQDLGLQEELTSALLERLGVEVGPETKARMARTPSNVPQALELNNEGSLLLREGRLDEAYIRLREALNHDDTYSVAWANLAEVAWRSGLYDQALEYRRNAAEHLPNYAPFHYNLGHLLSYLGQDDAAAESLRRALELDRSHVFAYNELANVLLRQGRPKAAADQLEIALLLEPSFAPLSKNLGRALLSSGDLEQAIVALEGSLSYYAPADLLGRCEANSLLVQALAKADEEIAACGYLRRLQELDPHGLGPFTDAALEAAVGLPCHETPSKEPFRV